MRYVDENYGLSFMGWSIEVLALIVYLAGVSLSAVSRIDGKLTSIPE